MTQADEEGFEEPEARQRINEIRDRVRRNELEYYQANKDKSAPRIDGLLDAVLMDLADYCVEAEIPSRTPLYLRPELPTAEDLISETASIITQFAISIDYSDSTSRPIGERPWEHLDYLIARCGSNTAPVRAHPTPGSSGDVSCAARSVSAG